MALTGVIVQTYQGQVQRVAKELLELSNVEVYALDETKNKILILVDGLSTKKEFQYLFECLDKISGVSKYHISYQIMSYSSKKKLN